MVQSIWTRDKLNKNNYEYNWMVEIILDILDNIMKNIMLYVWSGLLNFVMSSRQTIFIFE